MFPFCKSNFFVDLKTAFPLSYECRLIQFIDNSLLVECKR